MADQKPKKKKTTPSLTTIIKDVSLQIAENIGAKFIFLYADLIKEDKLLTTLAKNKEFVFLTKQKESLKKIISSDKRIIELPNVEFTRISMTKVSVMKGLYSGLISGEDKIIFLTGAVGLDYLDSLLVLDIGKEFEILASRSVSDIADNPKPEVFEAVLNLSIELAREGREGKSIGTIFVIGDDEKVMQLSRQMIFNPFRGYPDEEKNIVSPDIRDTIREFSAIDGAFVVRDDGVVLAAGRHLSAALEKQAVPMGLGSRHIAAAGITAVTNATAIVISESTGVVRIFKGGNIFMEIEKTVPEKLKIKN